jgi:hypothetical protein
MSSTENQLKFNLKAVVDNLNLINIVHKPEPILISKINSSKSYYDGRNVSGDFRASKSSSCFEVIDETKLSMYSYLIQRDLKAKEWLSKYEQNNASQSSLDLRSIDKPVKQDTKKTSVRSNENKNVAFSTTVTSKVPNAVVRPILKQKPLEQDVSNKMPSSIPSSSSTSSLKSTSEVQELKRCCDDSIKSIENLNSQLHECNTRFLGLMLNYKRKLINSNVHSFFSQERKAKSRV